MTITCTLASVLLFIAVASIEVDAAEEAAPAITDLLTDDPGFSTRAQAFGSSVIDTLAGAKFLLPALLPAVAVLYLGWRGNRYAVFWWLEILVVLLSERWFNGTGPDHAAARLCVVGVVTLLTFFTTIPRLLFTFFEFRHGAAKVLADFDTAFCPVDVPKFAAEIRRHDKFGLLS